MSARRQLAEDDAPLFAPARPPLVLAPPPPPDDAPRITADDEAAFAAWSAAHPAPAHRVPGLDHARWMRFSADRLLAAAARGTTP